MTRAPERTRDGAERVRGRGLRTGAPAPTGRLTTPRVLLAEVRRLALGRRVPALLAAAACSAVLLRVPGLRFSWGEIPADRPVGRVLTALPLFLVVAGGWASAVWHRERPAERDAFWVVPVAQGVHELARVAAGGVWLLAGIAAFLGASAVPGDGGALRAAGPWVIGDVVTAAATVYLLVAALALRTAHPGLWFVALVGGWTGVCLALDAVAPRLSDALGVLLVGRAGLYSALGAGLDLEERGGALRLVSAPAAWLVPMGAWLVGALTAVALAASRRREGS